MFLWDFRYKIILDIKMELHKSFLVLGLTEESSLQELTSVFRKLVKKYHPDLNQDNVEWSNRQMTYLNEAYDSVFKYLSSPEPEMKEVRTSGESVYNPQRDISDINFSRKIQNSLHALYNGMEIYYQYGLENIVLRQEGTRRSRFKSSIRRIKKSFALLKPLGELHLTQYESNQLEIIVNFIQYFYKSIHIRNLRAIDSSVYEKKAFKHYYFGAGLVDKIIKEIMFKEFVEHFKQGRLTENIKLAEAEFNTVIIDYPDAACLRDSEIKKELLLSFLEIIDLNDRNIIDFFN